MVELPSSSVDQGPSGALASGDCPSAVAGTGCPVLRWAATGLMGLTGRPDGPPAWPAGDPAGGLADLSKRLAAVSGAVGRRVEVGLAELLSGRAALLRLGRAGDRSAGGSARLLASADGWVALNLARQADHDSVPALVALLAATSAEASPGPLRAAPWGVRSLGVRSLGAGPAAGDEARWAVVARAVAEAEGVRVVEAGELLGIPVAHLVAPGPGPGRLSPGGRPWAASPLPAGAGPAWPRTGSRPLVVDLSSLWAGPLCAQLLGRAGCHVVKVESTARPDGARLGDPRVWRWLHEGHAARVFDFASVSGRRDLAGLLGQADVVIEASRGRALDQLGLGPWQLPTRPGAVWVTVTGYGRSSGRVAFGDDAAVAGGLVAWDERGPLFCGDAMGDPVAGLTAAVAVLEALDAGGGVHLDLSMVEAVRAVVDRPSPGVRAGAPIGAGHGWHSVSRRPDGSWEAVCGELRVPILPPVPPGEVPR